MTVQWRGAEVRAIIAAAASKGAVAGAEIVLEAGNAKIRGGSKTGRIYARRGVAHRASAPGESPASDTGNLVQSGKATARPGAGVAVAGVSWSTNYARALELGSNYQITGERKATDALQLEMGTQKLEPRPFARPALYENIGPITNAVRGEIARALAVGSTGPQSAFAGSSRQGSLF